MTPRRYTSPKRNGSVLVYMSVIMVAITTVVVGTVQLNVAASQKAERRIDDAKAEATFDAQVAQVIDLCRNNSITLPYAFNTTMNGKTLSCTVTDNDSTMSHSYNVTSTGSDTYSRSFSKLVGGRQMSHPLFFAFYAGRDWAPVTTGVTTTGTGSVFVDGKATFDAATSIGGDALSSNTMTPGSATVGKNCLGDQATVSWTNQESNTLKADATTLSVLPTLNNLSFLALLVNGHYALHFYDQDMTFSGLVSGKGTVVFNRNVTVSANVQYLTGASRAVFLVKGDLTINPAVTRLDGFWYVQGKIFATGTTSTLTNTRGAIANDDTITTTRPFNITYDSALWAGRPEGFKHCIPGFWPTADANMMR